MAFIDRKGHLRDFTKKSGKPEIRAKKSGFPDFSEFSALNVYCLFRQASMHVKPHRLLISIKTVELYAFIFTVFKNRKFG